MVKKYPFISCSFGSLSILVGFTGWWYRPLPLAEDLSLRRKRSPWASTSSISDRANKPPPFFYDLSRRLICALQVSLSRFMMFELGSFKIAEDKRYRYFLDSIVNRPKTTPIITVSNHRCTLDDVGVFPCLLPYWFNVQPRYLRYTLCAQEICFSEVLGSNLLP